MGGVRKMVFTIGYQQRNLKELIDELKHAGVDTLIDVRETAWSRKPGFSKSQLHNALSGHGIEYIHAPVAGNPRRFRRQARSQEECLALYSGYLSESPKVLREFHGLLATRFAADKRICLLCYERDPDDCHRSILLERWSESRNASVSIRHLATD